MNFNQATLCGNATQDATARTLPSGQTVCEFRVATNRNYTNSQGQKTEESEFHDVVVFGKLAEFASQYVKKGTLVLVQGRLHTRNWPDKAHPEIKHYRTEIIAERVELGPKRTKTTQAEMPDSGPDEGLTDQLPL
jgi:single-strand DNA-binding protein